MAEMEYRFDIRLTKQDKVTLKKRCRQFGMSQSDYMRMMINMPVEAVEAGMAADVFVIDRWGILPLAYQVRKLGYHYNQAVHALNLLVKYARQNEVDSADVVEVCNRVGKMLEHVGKRTYHIEKKLDGIVGTRFGIAFFQPNKYPVGLTMSNEDGAPKAPVQAREYQMSTTFSEKSAENGAVSTTQNATNGFPRSGLASRQN